MHDDDHRYGALRLSYDFEYAVLEESDKLANSNFEFNQWDTYQWFLDLGPLSNINDHYVHGKIPYWNDTVAHPNYDAYWKSLVWVDALRRSSVPNLNVAGFWDQEDRWVTRLRVNSGRQSWRRSSPTGCTATVQSPSGVQRFSRRAATCGELIRSGH